MIPPVQLIDPDGSFATAPHLRAFCDRLTEEGVRLEIASRLQVADAELPHGAAWVPFPPTVAGSARNLRQWLGRVRLWLAQRRAEGRQRLSRSTGAWVVGVNPEGLLYADRHAARTGSRLAYFANEIIFHDEARTSRSRRFKEREAVASRHASLVVASDERRRTMLRDENGLPPEVLFDLPVAPGGRARVRSEARGAGLPNLPPGCVTLLHAGSLRDWTGAHELIAAASRWPDDLRLVLHHPHGAIDPGLRVALDPCIRAGKILLDSTRLDGAAFDRLLAAVDFGIVLYRATFRDPFHGKNISEIGLASGKFAAYARAGLPVLAVDQRVYVDLNSRYGFGGTFGSPDEIPGLVRELIEQARRCSVGVAQLFNQELSFDRRWPELRARLASPAPS